MTGMMWNDESKDALAVKVQRAAEYYFRKYGARVTRCHVNPAEATEKAVGFINIVADKQIHKGYLWLSAEGVRS